MGYFRSEKHRNGDIYQKFDYFLCDKCGSEMFEGWPIFWENDKSYCPECAFRINMINSATFVDNVGGLMSGMFKAAINPETEDIEIALHHHKFSWEKTNKNYRHSKEYTDWRTKVFERDKYICQQCNQVGGRLNAHHIKPFSKYKRLRFSVNNGVTLCEKCHKALHRGCG